MNKINTINYSNLFDFVKENIEQLSEIKTQYLNLLSELTLCPNILDEYFYENLKKINCIGLIIIAWIRLPNEQFEIVGSGTIIIEPKIFRSGMTVGHIEDIVVKSTFRGKKISQNILNKLKDFGIDSNCYKIILDCDESVCNVYTSNGFKIKGIQMAQYLC